MENTLLAPLISPIQMAANLRAKYILSDKTGRRFTVADTYRLQGYLGRSCVDRSDYSEPWCR